MAQTISAAVGRRPFARLQNESALAQSTQFIGCCSFPGIAQLQFSVGSRLAHSGIEQSAHFT
jgi:hypothetical protein